MEKLAVLTPGRPMLLSGQLARYEPITPATALPLLLGEGPQPRLLELACRLGETPSQEALREAVEGAAVCLWRVVPEARPELREAAWVVTSRTTGTDCIALYLRGADPDENPLAQAGSDSFCALYADALETFSAALFAAGPEPTHIFSHVAIPTPEEVYGLFIRLGWDQWSTRYLNREPPRFLFGLSREVYNLYHAPEEPDAPL